jgi:hypothetical protein
MAVPAIESAGGVVWKMMNSSIMAKTTYLKGDVCSFLEGELSRTYRGVKSEGAAANSFTLKALGQKRLHDFRMPHGKEGPTNTPVR